jgi:hypothetical protein
VLKRTSGTDVKLFFKHTETATGRSLTNKDASVVKFYSDDVSKLAGKAIDA